MLTTNKVSQNQINKWCELNEARSKAGFSIVSLEQFVRREESKSLWKLIPVEVGKHLVKF